VSALDRDIDAKDQERTRLLTEKGRLEQEAEVGFHVCNSYNFESLILPF